MDKQEEKAYSLEDCAYIVLPESSTKRLASMGTVIEIPKNHTIYKAGDVSDYCYLLLEGRVKVHEYSYDGTDRIYKFCTPGTLTVNGTVTADGSGRSSGGSVWLRAKRFVGTSTVRAVPGTGDRPGSGGRLALEATDYAFTGSFNVSPGCYKNTNPSQSGTIFLGKGSAPVETPLLSAAYTAEGFTSANHPISSAADATGEALVVERVYSQYKPNSYAWTEKCYRLKDGSRFENGATYTVAGLKPNALVEVMHNGVAVLNDGKNLRADAEGRISFSAELTEPNGDTFEVRPRRGLAIVFK